MRIWPAEPRATRPAVALLLALGLAACARTPPPAIPEGVDLVYPSYPAEALERGDARRMEKGWAAVRAGDAAGAEKHFRAVLARRPAFAPAETGLGYARLRLGRYEAARALFDAALEREPGYLPALLGAATTALKLGEPLRALELYRRAHAVNPQDPVVRRRLPEVRMQATEGWIHAGRAALAEGDATRAAEEFQQALAQAPEVVDLRLETAGLLAEQGDLAGAVRLLEQDPTQARDVRLRLGRLLSESGDHLRALETFRQLLERDPGDAEVRREAEAVRQAYELARMPQEYQRIAGSPRLTRAELAALLAIKVTALGKLEPGEPEVATDISGSWARAHILSMLALSVMDVYPNHTFQPGATVRRGDLADSIGRILDRLGWPAGAAPVLRDMSAAHLYQRGATRAVAAGLMDVTPRGDFEPWRPVTGKDALAIVEALARLVGP